MSTIKVEVKGQVEALLAWDGKSQGFTDSGDSSISEFEASKGSHVYAIVLQGAPGGKWTATVSGGKKKFSHSGRFSPAGIDGTGDTPYEV